MTISIKTDELLVTETREGSGKAFARLVERHQNRVYATAIGVLSDFELAQDVAQDAFLNAYHNLSKLREPECFGARVSTIARHTALAARRERSKVEALADRYRADKPLSHFVTPQEELEGTERGQIVHRARERLSRKDRETLSLYYLEDLSYSGVATALGVTETVVKGRLQRARPRLRKELKMVEEQFLGARLPEDFVARIKALLDLAAEDKAHRQATIEALGEMGDRAVEPLTRALNDERKWVRYAAALSLCTIGDSRALQPMLRLLWTDKFYAHEEDGFPDLEVLGRVLAIPGMREAVLDHVREHRAPHDSHYPGERSHLFMRILSQAKQDDDEVFATLYGIFSSDDDHSASRCQALWSLCVIGPPDRAQRLLMESIDSGNKNLLECAFGLASKSYRHSFGRPPLEICEKVLSNAPI